MKTLIVVAVLWTVGCGYSEAEMQMARDKLAMLQAALNAANADRADAELQCTSKSEAPK